MLLAENIASDTPLHDRLVSRQRDATEIVAEGIRRGQAAGRYRPDIDPAGKAVEILAFINGMEATLWLLDPSIPLAEVFKQYGGLAGPGLVAAELDVRYRLDVVAPTVLRRRALRGRLDLPTG